MNIFELCFLDSVFLHIIAILLRDGRRVAERAMCAGSREQGQQF